MACSSKELHAICFLWAHVFYVHVRGFFKIIVWSIWLISICLNCIIANDNVKLHTIQKKYVLLREFARLNQE